MSVACDNYSIPTESAERMRNSLSKAKHILALVLNKMPYCDEHDFPGRRMLRADIDLQSENRSEIAAFEWLYKTYETSVDLDICMDYINDAIRLVETR